MTQTEQIERLRAALKDARTTLQMIDGETCSIGTSYGLPRVAEMASRCAIRCNIALAAAVPPAEPEGANGRKGMPLRASVADGCLTLSIGVKTLAFAFENSEENNPYDEDFCDTKRQYSIADPLKFAEDICHEMNDEGEDGSTPLTRFLDSMMQSAVDQGSLGVYDPEDEIAAPEAQGSPQPEGGQKP